MRSDVRLSESVERGIGFPARLEPWRRGRPVPQIGRREISADPFDLRFGQAQSVRIAFCEFRLDGDAHGLRPFFMDEDFDARFELVVAAAFDIVDPDDRLRVGEKIGRRQKISDLMADHRGASEAAADINSEAGLTGIVSHELVADIVHLNGGPIMCGAQTRRS